MPSECPRHEGLDRPPWRVVRCRHIGDRFVVQHDRPETGYVSVDYVEDLPDNELIVEATDWYHPSAEEIERVWASKVGRMLADAPPDPAFAFVI